MTDLMPCIKDKSPEEVLEVIKSHLMMEDIKRFIVREDGKEVVYVKQVKGEPSAQPERKESDWIPCSEKLPENDECVLATTAWGDVTIAERVYTPIDDTCWFIHDGNTNATIDDVVAWMPMPELYRGEQE